MEKKLDLLLINVPLMSVAYAPAGTSLLKACVQSRGFTCKVIDFNIDFWNKQNDKDEIAELEQSSNKD
jgi:hypothetical protein